MNASHEITSETGSAADRLSAALDAQRERLLPCVHCGFCLPACPTYNRLGDENDSPRGRLHLMKAVVEGRLDASSTAFQTHIDRCLGCRACEPVCPSGVEYGTLLELARDVATNVKPPSVLTRALLTVMGSAWIRRPFFLGGRLVRASGLAAFGVRVLPGQGALGTVRLALAMLAASEDSRTASSRLVVPPVARNGEGDASAESGSGSVAVLRGCVQAGLYGRVNDATARTLYANGYVICDAPGQDCCGALHAHGGDLEGARRLARRNIDAFEAAGTDRVAVNAAGCGAAMKEYGTLLEQDAVYASRARAFSERVRDVTEMLAVAGPRRGAKVSCSVAYDHPCHLLHAQGVESAPLDVLAAIPGVEVRVVQKADECCGGAGIYGMTHPDLGSQIGGDKIKAVRAEQADVACTPNPGCMMQIGAGLRIQGQSGAVVHPVELLDESYEKAGYYQ
jgi:glycolate oxidase iron-sulfur subunit